MESAESRRFCDPEEPLDAKYWLGNLILVGDQIQHLQRIHVASEEAQLPPSKLTATSPVVNTLLAHLGAHISLTLPKGDLSALSTGELAVNPKLSLTLDAAGTDKSVRAGTLKSKEGALLPPGPYALIIDSKGTEHVVNIQVKQQQLTATGATSFKAADLKLGTSQVTLVTSDGDLSNSVITSDAAWLTLTKATPAGTDSSKPLGSVTYKLMSAAPVPGPVHLLDSQSKNIIELSVVK